MKPAPPDIGALPPATPTPVLGLVARMTRDKADTLLLLLAALMVLLPHFAHLPLWTSVTATLTLAWRAAITLLGRRLPPLWILLPVSVLAMGGVYLSFRTLLGRDPGVAMLALLLAFKLLEMQARRDLYVVVFLCFFLLLTDFFYSQSIFTALTMMATIVMLLTALVTFQYTGIVPPLKQRLLMAARIFLVAAPLGLLLFVAFPRIQGPLWGLPGDARSGRTGISDTMAPGSLSSLAASDDIAFRVRFFDPRPRQNQLYWRGVVLGNYDGRTWTRSGRPLYRGGLPAGLSIHLRGPGIRHEITMEPSGKRFLFTLEFTEPDLSIPGQRLRSSDELESYVLEPLHERLRYRAKAYPDFSLKGEASPARTAQWRQLPPGFNPRALELAASLRALNDPQGAVRAVLRKFRSEPYRYTLTPPALGRDAVDEFLFASRAGFCEHYASAFVYLMRAAGIPARVVTGYQGGELNPVDGYLLVRQSDAHAWAEVWLGEQGWQRVDPTAAVAPQRVEQSLARAIPAEPPFGLEGLAGLVDLQNDRESWLSWLRFNANAINNSWNQWVLDYNPERQRNFLAELNFALGNWRSALGLVLVALLLFAAQRLRAGRGRDPVDTAYQAFCRQMARRGLPRAADEGPRSYAARILAAALPEDKKAAMKEFLELYGALQYGVPDSGGRTHSVKRLNTLLMQSR
ncbi:transglutaminase TgpA family protein [Pseudoduganella violacea]|uniref:Transglutaminase-like putative cysteine protease n=1 Tax=Pseudoduganella violacea TaxID=1715466 RepID=A0A7W5FUU4_9BURK|nr:DUF3488 and transglutaminase-like domain-containing protein [Pseudoduganella violacea]MBB3119543.1 transglutaminase-like putative cysteine protease [Pseudoduganella violacea]